MIVIEKEMSKTNKPILKINQLYVHSKYDPQKEASRIVDQLYKKHHIHVVFGYGCGYVIDELLERDAEKKIVVIDPLIEQQKLSIDARHVGKITHWDETNINTLNFILNKIGQQLDRKIQIITTPNYEKLFMNEYAELLKKIRDFQSKSLIGTNTEVLFAEEWQRNLTFNLRHLVQDFSLMELRGIFNLPVIIASGGPSLTKQLPLLKEIEDSVIIVASGSTINSLLAADIEPDFVVSIDGGEPNYEHFKDVQTENTRLIYSTFNHYKIRPIFTKQSYAFIGINESAVQRYIQQKFDHLLPRVSGSGTVAHFAYSVAHTMNSGPVALIGQDLAYTNGQSHAQNNKYFKKMTKGDIDLIETDGYYDEPVLTSRVFLSMKTTFEEMVRFHEVDQPTFNCTEGGIKIKGMEQLPFKQFIDIYVDRNKKKDFTDIDCKEYKHFSSEQFIEIMKEELKIISNLVKECKKSVNLLNSNKSKEQFSSKILKKLDKIDRIIEKDTKNIQIHYLIKPIYVEVETLYLEKENETPEETFNRVKHQSEALYKKLELALKKTKVNIEQLIEQLEREK